MRQHYSIRNNFESSERSKPCCEHQFLNSLTIFNAIWVLFDRWVPGIHVWLGFAISGWKKGTAGRIKLHRIWDKYENLCMFIYIHIYIRKEDLGIGGESSAASDSRNEAQNYAGNRTTLFPYLQKSFKFAEKLDVYLHGNNKGYTVTRRGEEYCVQNQRGEHGLEPIRKRDVGITSTKCVCSR